MEIIIIGTLVFVGGRLLHAAASRSDAARLAEKIGTPPAKDETKPRMKSTVKSFKAIRDETGSGYWGD
jgi:hypothetical protein